MMQGGVDLSHIGSNKYFTNNIDLTFSFIYMQHHQRNGVRSLSSVYTICCLVSLWG